MFRSTLPYPYLCVTDSGYTVTDQLSLAKENFALFLHFMAEKLSGQVRTEKIHEHVQKVLSSIYRTSERVAFIW